MKIGNFVRICCFFLISMGIVLWFSSCEQRVNSQNLENDKARQWMTQNGHLKVLSTLAMIEDLVKEIGGEYVDSATLIKGELDPHSYQLVKGDDEKLLFADVVFYNGLGLEHGPSLQYHLEHNPKAVALGNRIQSDNPELILSVRGQYDPHIWMDISLWSRLIPYITEELSRKDPEHADIYRSNAEQLEQRLHSAHEDVIQLLQSIPENHRYLVTSHDAFNYFTRAYLATKSELETGGWEKRFAAPEGLAPESQLSTLDIQEIIEHLEKYQINVIFPESNVSKDSIRKIVSAGKEKGRNVRIADDVLYGDAMGPSGSEENSYIRMIQYDAKIIAKYLSEQK